MLNLTNFQKAGYGAIFVETMEMKRAIRSIEIDKPFKTKLWSPIRGLINNYHSFSEDEPMNAIEILQRSVGQQSDGSFAAAPVNTAFILESFDEFIDTFDVLQTILDIYDMLKANATMLVMVGSNSDSIPSKLKEFIPVVEFHMPDESDIRTIAEGIAESSIDGLGDEYADEFEINDAIIEACKGLTWEEIENALAKSAVETRSFDYMHIMERKQLVIKQTGFMQFIEPESIENLGGLEKFKTYWELRSEPFINDDSNKPKVKAVLCAGFPGTGKSLGAKVLGSILNWPVILFDVGAVKEGIVGETEKKMRKATYTIDSIGRCIVVMDEIEKFFGSSSGNGVNVSSSGVDEGMLGHMLTWMQERKSEGILYGTANNLDALPPEFKRAGGRWDTIFFVNLPNPDEIEEIISIHNRKYKSQVPSDPKFCKTLSDEGWSGAEIEQLAKDSHYESIKECIENIPILSKHESDKFERTRKLAKMYRWANTKKETGKVKPRKLKLN
jgi:SpoVK/Ycf46/Vps4 family AAA+-type ATPase